MAYTLNTGHALYSSLIELIGVQGGALVSHKTTRTFTAMGTPAGYGSGALGEYFKTGASGWNVNGASFSPAVIINENTTPNHTTLIIVSNVGNPGFYATDSLTAGLSSGISTSVGIGTDGKPSTKRGYGSFSGQVAGPTSVVNAGVTSLAVTKTGNTSNQLYVNGVLAASGGPLADEVRSDNDLSILGGMNGQGSIGGVEFVWVARFNKALTAAELLDLHQSLNAGNVFGLVASATLPPHMVTVANSNQANVASSVAINQTVVAGTITLPACRQWETGNLRLSESGVTVIVNNLTTGALVVKKTGLTTHATTGICVVNDAAIVAGTPYRVTQILADGNEGTWKYTAS